MYTFAIDLPTSCLVGVHSGASSDDEDYRASIDALAFIDLRGILPLKLALLVVNGGEHTPNSAWRRRFAELRRNARSRHRIGFICDSRLARGAIIAIDWLQPPNAQQQVKAWATVKEGIAWLERERGEPVPILRHLYFKARDAGLPPSPGSRVGDDLAEVRDETRR
jgi:hypothetical protein